MSEHYEGREQSETKHLILEAYLRTLIFKIANKAGTVSFVDGFSGPWQSRASSYRDTSFGIALRCLKATQAALAEQRNIKIKINCIFCEKENSAYVELEKFASGFVSSNFNVTTINDEFSNVIEKVSSQTRGSFRLIFIDPKGWTGYGFKSLSRISGPNSEMIINFMYDHSNRFFEDQRDTVKSSFYELFHEEDLEKISGASDREGAAIEIFSQKMKSITGYEYVACSRVSRPLADRTQFILFFGTNSLKGLEVFRDAEAKGQTNFAYVRAKAREKAKEERLKQGHLPGLTEQLAEADWQRGRKEIQQEAKREIVALVSDNPMLPYATYKASLLQRYAVRASEINALVKELGKEGVLRQSWKQANPRKQIPADDCKISLAE